MNWRDWYVPGVHAAPGHFTRLAEIRKLIRDGKPIPIRWWGRVAATTLSDSKMGTGLTA